MTTDPHTHTNPWDLQPGETADAYYWFSRYLDLPPNERSLSRLVSDAIGRGMQPAPASNSQRTGGRGHRKRGSEDAHVPSRNTLMRWSARHRWEQRGALYDQEAERRRREALEDEVTEAAKRHALQLRLAANVLVWPLQRFWERATDPAEREKLAAEFESMTGPQLLQLGANVSRALNVLQAAEREALGMKVQQAPEVGALDEGDVADYAGTIERVSAVLAALEEAGYVPSRDDA